MKLSIVTSMTAIFLLSAVACHAGEPAKDPMLTYQGFTGILNTPNAFVNQEGSIHFLYSDQRENIWRDDKQKRQDNYLMSIGLFSFFELGGRLTDAPGRARDLSASIKVSSAPLTRDHPLWPVVAAGIQDVGGGSNLLESRYAVISEDLWRFRFSAGYGFHSERMKGAFGGVEFQAHDWVTLLAEHDTRDTSAGIRIVTPEIWITPVQLAATVKSTLNHKPGHFDVAVGLTFPLDFRKRAGRDPEHATHETPDGGQKGKAELPAPAQQSSPPLPVVPTPQVAVPTVPSVPSSKPASGNNGTNLVSSAKSVQLDILQKHLTKAGFINVRVGQRVSRELVVEYENSIFNHNELDALGVVAGIVSEVAAEDFETLRIVIKRNRVRMAVVTAPLATVRGFMHQPLLNSRELKESILFSYDTSITDDAYFQPEESSFPFPNTSLILSPGLQTFVGTEVGVFDYLLSFRPEIISNLWNGGVFQARWDIPLSWSSNFNNSKAFRGSRNDPRMDRAMLFQGVNLAPGVMANLGAGLVLHNTYGTLNELMWSPGEGTHRLRAAQAWARDQNSRKTMDMYLGSYRYFFAPYDLSLEVSGGKFWGQDTGFSVELKRFFADTAISTYYKNSTTAERKHWQLAGIQLAFPLTPRKDLKIGPLQIRGSDEWSYSQETTLAIGSQKTNDVLSQGIAINPQPTTALYHSYYNRDRLGEDYFKQHIDRLREAWNRYRTDLFDKK